MSGDIVTEMGVAYNAWCSLHMITPRKVTISWNDWRRYNREVELSGIKVIVCGNTIPTFQGAMIFINADICDGVYYFEA